MKHLSIILITILLTSCGLKSKIETHDKAKEEADFIVENFTNYDLIKDKLPEKFFQPSQTKEYIANVDQNCDWTNRRGKFVDFFSMKNVGGIDQTAFIYEYFLDCDSLRVILIFNMVKESPEVFKINLEPLETPNQMIIDPSKQLIPK